MTKRHAQVGAVLIALVCCAVGRAEAPPSADPDTDAAQRHYQLGVEHYAAGRMRDALREFSTARQLSPRPELEYDIGRCHDRMEAWGAAADAYERFLTAVPEADNASALRERVAVLRARDRGPPRRVPLAAPIVMGGLAIASAVVAAALIGTANADYDTIVPGCTPRCDPALIDPLAHRAYAGYALFGVAGAAAAVDLALWIAYGRPRRPQASAARLDGNGLRVTW